MFYFTSFMMLLHAFVGVILIGIILLQRGRGGGLAGAFGGMGGQSAFGTKAGDVFTKITIYLATAWIVLGCFCVLLASSTKVQTEKFKAGEKAGMKEAEAEDKDQIDKKADAKADAKSDATDAGKTSNGTKNEDIDVPAPAPAVPPTGESDAGKDLKLEGNGLQNKTDAKETDKTDSKPESKDPAPGKNPEPEKKSEPAKEPEPSKKVEPEKKDESAQATEPAGKKAE
jgi:preprotein translocase subunit SecG